MFPCRYLLSELWFYDQPADSLTWSAHVFMPVEELDDILPVVFVSPPVRDGGPQLWMSGCGLGVVGQNDLVTRRPQTPQAQVWFLLRMKKIHEGSASSFFPPAGGDRSPSGDTASSRTTSSSSKRRLRGTGRLFPQNDCRPGSPPPSGESPASWPQTPEFPVQEEQLSWKTEETWSEVFKEWK